MEILDSVYVDLLLDEALDLVQRTIDYTDDQGRIDRALADTAANAAFVAESSRHSTRLMQIVAWLFAQRAVYEGEMTPEEGLAKENRLGSKGICLSPPVKGWDGLHPDFRSLLVEGEDLYLRICRLDDHYAGKGHKSPVHELLSGLSGSFPGTDKAVNDD